MVFAVAQNLFNLDNIIPKSSAYFGPTNEPLKEAQNPQYSENTCQTCQLNCMTLNIFDKCTYKYLRFPCESVINCKALLGNFAPVRHAAIGTLLLFIKKCDS